MSPYQSLVRTIFLWCICLGSGGALIGVGCVSLPSLEGLPCAKDADCGGGLACSQKLCRRASDEPSTPDEPPPDSMNVCKVDETRPCGSDTGECKKGVQKCNATGQWENTCAGEVKSTAEECDGKDNDCDGQIDNNPRNPPLCSNQAGVCAGSRQSCVNGKWQPCSSSDYKARNPEYNSTLDKCDNKDNNCDGRTDENAPECVTTIAGINTIGHQDGPGNQAKFSNPDGITIDAQGNLYIADTTNYRIRKIDLQGNVFTIAGVGQFGYQDGPAAQAIFKNPSGVAVDIQGNFYIADSGNQRIRKLDINGNVTTLAGTGEFGHKDGLATQAIFYNPTNVAVDAQGNLYIADTFNHRIRKIDTKGNVSTLAGTKPTFRQPHGIAVDTQGNIFVADTDNHRICKIDTKGNVTTLAGTGQPGYRDGPATQAVLYKPYGLTIDTHGNIFITEIALHIIRKIDTKGNVTTLAGTDQRGYQNGPAAKARFAYPRGITIDAQGNLYIVDTNNFRIRKLTP